MQANELGTRCAWCTRIRDQGSWVTETAAHTFGNTDELRWSHGICPDCAEKLRLVPALGEAGPRRLADQ